MRYSVGIVEYRFPLAAVQLAAPEMGQRTSLDIRYTWICDSLDHIQECIRPIQLLSIIVYRKTVRPNKPCCDNATELAAVHRSSGDECVGT